MDRITVEEREKWQETGIPAAASARILRALDAADWLADVTERLDPDSVALADFRAMVEPKAGTEAPE